MGDKMIDLLAFLESSLSKDGVLEQIKENIRIKMKRFFVFAEANNMHLAKESWENMQLLLILP